MSLFAQRLIDWQRQHGRHDLPWQGTREPYRVWLSEIMLQQTQVTSVIPYYARFLERFPTLSALAATPLEEVMALWSGLGYYARARNLHACARQVMARHGGNFPHDPAAIAALPGIGRSTAHAIAVFCFAARLPILDGNVKRLLCRFGAISGYPGTAAVASRLWQDAESLLPAADVAVYTQAQMDMGASICTRSRPRCTVCPVADLCLAKRDGRETELPTPRPRKVLPEKSVTVLVLCDSDRVLLETRPPSGIWGGLLSLPELPAGADVADYCRRHLGVTIGAVSPAPTLVHMFTHFRLHIAPLVCVAQPQAVTAEPGQRWVARTALGEVGLPAPIRRMLSAIP